VIIVAGQPRTGPDIVFDASYANLHGERAGPSERAHPSTNNNFRIFTCDTGATGIGWRPDAHE